MSDRTDNTDNDGLRQSVTDMRVALEEGPLGRLRTMLTAGAIKFESDSIGEDLTRVLAEVAEIVRKARSEASQWVSRNTRTAATPIGLDRLERVEDFFRMVEEFSVWAEESERRSASGGDEFDHSEWRHTLLDVYGRILHACRSMRREIMMGRGYM